MDVVRTILSHEGYFVTRVSGFSAKSLAKCTIDIELLLICNMVAMKRVLADLMRRSEGIFANV